MLYWLQEAIWAARNLKYFPLAVQDALNKGGKLADARDYKVLWSQISVIFQSCSINGSKNLVWPISNHDKYNIRSPK